MYGDVGVGGENSQFTIIFSQCTATSESGAKIHNSPFKIHNYFYQFAIPPELKK
jgi:hypothetical protein